MILPSITDRRRAFLAEYCCYMPCLAISKFYRSWNFHAKVANPMINGQKVYHDDLYDENTKNNKITCTSCSTTMLSSECPSKHVCTLTIKLADGKLQAYTCFNNALQSFLAAIEKSTSLDDITRDELEDFVPKCWHNTDGCK